MFSAKTVEHGTPQSFYDALDAVFHFELDAAASPENPKCARVVCRWERFAKKGPRLNGYLRPLGSRRERYRTQELTNRPALRQARLFESGK